MRALLCGVRGSTPVSAPEFVDVGGNTSCVAIPAVGGRWLVLDAGTGFAKLAGALGGGPLRGSVLLTHLHWDHTQGLPFLPNADRPDAEVDVWMPPEFDERGRAADPTTVMARAMSPPHFPIGPGELRGRWRFDALPAGRHRIEGFHVTVAEIHHKGGRTHGFRIESHDAALAYLPDHCPQLASPQLRANAKALADGVDVLLHGGEFLTSERDVADSYGHATVDDAIEFATQTCVRHLVLIHHSPRRTDLAVAAIERSLSNIGGVTISIGREDDWVDCPPVARLSS